MSKALAKTDQIAVFNSREAIKAVARDIGKQVANHIEIMYPDAVKAASSTFLLSVRGCVHNEIMAAIDSNIDVSKRLAFNSAFRKHIRKMYKQIRRGDGI